MPRLTTAEAAELLGVTTTRVRAMLDAGILTGINEPFGPGTRWLVDRDSVEARKLAAKASRGKLKRGGRPKQE